MTDIRPAEDTPQPVLEAAFRAASAFVATLGERPAAWAADGTTVDRAPDGIGALAAIEHFRRELEPRLSGSAGPRYFGFVTGGANPAGLAGDWLAAAYDQNVSNDIGSLAADVERVTAAAYAGLFGLSPQMRGWFVSGATASNTVALATARQTLYHHLGIDTAEHGLHGAPPLRVVGGAPHSSIAKAMSVLGLGRAQLHGAGCLPGRTAVDPAKLAAVLAADRDRPTVVVASAGEVNTGDFDDLTALAALCREHGAWLHVDAAFGLFAALSPRHAARLAGIDDADSVTVDLHKWLNVPYDSALVYTRHPERQRDVFRASSAYLGDSPDPLHYTPENSRRFRALPAWMTLAAYGRDGIAQAIVRCCELAVRLGDGIATLPAFERLAEVELNIVCFALRDRSEAARDRLLQRLTADGRAFMTPTRYADRPAIRAAVSNWTTTGADIELTLQALGDAAAP